jgi:hypothetical protein
VTAKADGLLAPRQVSAALDVVPPPNDASWAGPDADGVLRSADDRLLLRIPRGAASARARFSYTAVAVEALPQPLDGLRFAFRLDAADTAGRPQRAFARPLAFSVAYRPEEFPLTAGAPILYYYRDC